MSIYHTTYLYIKRHRDTGLNYFGKTTKLNVESYKGSGKRWLRHLKKHGSNVETIWISEPFLCQEELTDFSLLFSELFDIVNSPEWANLIPENGLDGAPKGVPKPDGFGLKFIGEKNAAYGKPSTFAGRRHTDAQKKLWSEMKRGIPQGPKSEETKIKLRVSKKNKENYKGTPGKITCINKQGLAVQIYKEQYNKQKETKLDVSEWEFVNTNSNEAKRRRLNT